MVSIATKEMMPLLSEIWRLNFDDSQEYTDFVFARILDPSKILVYLDKAGQPIGMLCMEPIELVSGESSCPAVYMYAFSVHPRFQSRGIGGKLLEGFHKYCKSKGYYASVLTPASKTLFDYYEGRGYTTQFAVRQLKLDGSTFLSTGRRCTLINRSFDSLYRTRNDFFGSSKLLVKWSPAYLRFVGEETKTRGGEVLCATVRDKKGYLVYRLENKVAVITEFAIPHDCMDDVLYSLHKRINAVQYKIRLSSDYPSQDGGKVLPFAMIQWYDKLKMSPNLSIAPYISHVMD